MCVCFMDGVGTLRVYVCVPCVGLAHGRVYVSMCVCDPWIGSAHGRVYVCDPWTGSAHWRVGMCICMRMCVPYMRVGTLQGCMCVIHG